MPSVVPRTKMISCVAARVEELLHLGAGLFVGLGGALAQLVHAAVDVGAIHFVNLTMASMTARGFWAVAALSR